MRHAAERLEENFGTIEPEALRDSVGVITEGVYPLRIR